MSPRLPPPSPGTITTIVAWSTWGHWKLEQEREGQEGRLRSSVQPRKSCAPGPRCINLNLILKGNLNIIFEEIRQNYKVLSYGAHKVVLMIRFFA